MHVKDSTKALVLPSFFDNSGVQVNLCAPRLILGDQFQRPFLGVPIKARAARVLQSHTQVVSYIFVFCFMVRASCLLANHVQGRYSCLRYRQSANISALHEC